MRSVKTWLLYGVLLACMIYSALALTVRPAYAAGCDCQQALNYAYSYCSLNGGGAIAAFSCTDGASAFGFYCWNGMGGTVSCP